MINYRVNHLKYNVVFIILGLLSCLAFYDIDNKPEMEKSKLDIALPPKIANY